MSYHRIVVKLGTNLLTAGSDHLSLETMASLVGQIARLHKEGLGVVLLPRERSLPADIAWGLPKSVRKSSPGRCWPQWGRADLWMLMISSSVGMR